MIRSHVRPLATVIASLVAMLPTPAFALEVRHPETAARYATELTRAYVPCVVPNDTTADGIPACSPAVTSSCTFDRGTLDVRPRAAASQTRVDVLIRDVAGPGSCPMGTYTLELALRVTADDPTCSGGQCTFEDVIVSPALSFNPPNDVELVNGVLENLLPGGLTGAHYEILGATIIAPDGLPMAAAGIGTNDAESVLGTTGAGYAACTAPNTSGTIGNACTPLDWPSGCDSNHGVLRWRMRVGRGPELSTTFDDLVGPSPDCRNGTYAVVSRARVTTGPCTSSALCTTVEFPISVDATAKNGKIDDDVLLSTLGVFSTPITSMEIHAVEVVDPAGATFATTAVNPVLRLEKPKVTIARGDLLDPNDDQLRLDARFPLVSIDPTENPGVTFTVTDRNGLTYEVTIPGALWQLIEPIGTRWEFVDDAGGIGGVRKVSIKQFKQGGAPAGYKIKLYARDVDLSAADLPGVNLLISIPPPGGFAVTTAQRNRTCKVGGHSLSCR